MKISAFKDCHTPRAIQDRELVSLSKYLTHIATSGISFQTFEHKVCKFIYFYTYTSLIFSTELEESRFSIRRRKCTWTFRLHLITLILLHGLFLQDLRRVCKCIIATVYNTLSHASGFSFNTLRTQNETYVAIMKADEMA